MEHYKLILAYDGTHFQGYQRQGQTRTVQSEIEIALRQLGWKGKSILSSGRTDTGVHASGQVIAFDLDWTHTPDDLVYALNAGLPEDIVVQQAQVVAKEFHPRYDAVERAYRYRIYLALHNDPLRERFAWRLTPDVDLELLEQAASLLPGNHDFAAFGRPPQKGGSTIRHIYRAAWQAKGDELEFEIRGNAFLYHMVRRLVMTQVQVGQKRLSLDEFAAAVRETRPLPPGLAPAQGLVLLEVRYAADRQEAVRLMKTLL
jgi:tRNA pseudouridine38-40 synthase